MASSSVIGTFCPAVESDHAGWAYQWLMRGACTEAPLTGHQLSGARCDVMGVYRDWQAAPGVDGGRFVRETGGLAPFPLPSGKHLGIRAGCQVSGNGPLQEVQPCGLLELRGRARSLWRNRNFAPVAVLLAPGGTDMERSRNVEDLHHLRLMALLHELVRERDLKGAAEALGLDPRTLSASMDRGALSGLAQVALERWLLAEGDREAAQARDEVRELAGRVDGVEQRVDGLADEVGKAVVEVQQVAEEAGGNDAGARAQELQRLERRMDRVEAAGRVGIGLAGGPQATAAGRGPVNPRLALAASPRRYPDLVTRDPDAGDEEVFGDAWPLVAEWRALWKDHPDRGRGVRWLETEARILELELAMLEEQGLTLPPETEPLRGLERNAQLGWRRRALAVTEKKLARRRALRRLRRLITLGLWRR